MEFDISHSDRIDVSIHGLGHIGLPLAVAFAEVGLNVLGVDVNDAHLTRIRSGQSVLSERELGPRLLEVSNKKHFQVSSQATPCPVHIICVGTNLGHGETTQDLTDLRDAVNTVASILTDGDLVVLRSTVGIGSTRNFVQPILDRAGCKYLLANCPERTLEGTALRELNSLPQIVGGLTAAATEKAAALFAKLTDCVVRVDHPETAEIAKLSLNTMRDLSFAFANEVAFVCDAVGVSIEDVRRAANTGYPRQTLAQPGPVGGPCLTKDPVVLQNSADAFGLEAGLARASRKVNQSVPSAAVETIARAYRRREPPSKIVLAGLAFKGRPAVADIRGSQAFPLLSALKHTFPKAEFVGVDPEVSETTAADAFGLPLERNLFSASRGCNLLVFQSNHSAFSDHNLEDIASEMRQGGLIYDFWSQFSRMDNLPNGVSYTGFGSGHFGLLA